MANIKISELNPLVTIQDADVLPIVDNAVTKKVTAAILRSYTEGNSVLLTTAQTVAGIKTFTAQLASTVATGTAPFSVASTTKVTNLNADLLDGLSSADFALSTRTLTAGTGLTGGGDLTANRTFAIDSTVATLTGTQTLTNKTITSPVINEILDSNGNEILGFTPIASATDYITIKNGIGVGVPLHISAAGSSTNTGLHLEPKGSGLVQISDGTDTTKGFRFRSSASATGAVTLIDAVSSAGRVITLPDATTTLIGTNTTDTITNKSISGATNTLTNIGNASLTNSAITINGTSTSLGGSINVGTVTSVAALTLGTSGTDLTSSVATGTTTPVITLNVPTASASNRGALSSTDWSTFNGKQNAITLTTTGTSGAATLVGSTLNIPNYADTDTGITSLNGLTALTQTFAVGTSGADFGISSATSTHTFNLPTASAANRGALSSADWTTFNNKQNALTNPITGTGTANFLPKFTSGTSLVNSQIYEDGSNIGIGTITPGTTTANTLLGFLLGSNIQARNAVPQLAISSNINGDWYAPTYKVTNFATQIYLDSNQGTIALRTAPSGTAGDNINWNTPGIYIANNSNVGIGTTSPSNGKLVVKDSGYQYIAEPTDSATYGYLGIGHFINGTFIGTTAGSNTASDLLRFGTSGTERMRIASGGNVLIGTTTDSGYKLDVNGTARVSGAATFSADATINGVTVGRGAGNLADNTAVGASALNANTIGTNNVAVGVRAMISNTQGLQNSAFGGDALGSNTTGNYNSAFGQGAMYGNLTGSNNSAFGQNALVNNLVSGNTGIGFEAAFSNTSGTNIVAIGYQASRANTTGLSNTSIGYTTLKSTTTGSANSALGESALFSNTTGSSNTAMGVNTLFANVTGSFNTAIGRDALQNNTASNNTAVGFEAGYSNTSGDEITALGYRALKANTTGVSNTAFGSTALSANTTGNCNTAIGSNAMNANTTGSNNNVIGYNQVCTNFSGVSMLGRSDTATGSNQMRFGSSAINNGAVATEVVVSDTTWAVFINGVAYKILLKA